MSNVSGIPDSPMTVDEFLSWADGRPGRYELYMGRIYAMSPERSRHAETKYAAARALDDAIRTAGLKCHMLPDGMTVRIDATTAHEPDALVYCGDKLPGDAIEVPSPVIIVEVLSPATTRIDASKKLTGYFSLPSVHHYLIIDPEKALAIHHLRQGDGTILTRIMRDGTIRFEPPGFEMNLERILQRDTA